MRIIVGIMCMIIFLTVGLVEWVKGDIYENAAGSTNSASARLKVRLYVFNDKTQLWDRAREETLKNITCDKLRGVDLPSGNEYNVDIEKEK